MTIRIAAISASIVFGAALAGCASTQNALPVAWVSPDRHVPPFDRVMLAPVETQYRDVAPMTGTYGNTLNRSEFPVPESGRKRITDIFNESFRNEIGDDSHFTMTDQPGPGVLLVKPSLRDIVSRVPPEELPGRSDTFLDTVADATLVVDLVDAESGQTLGTITDRRTAESPGARGGSFGATRSDPVNTGQEIRQLASRWARSLDSRLEQLYFEAKPR